MTATEVKSETVTIAVAVVTVKDDPEPQLAVSLGGQTTVLHFYDGLRLCHAMTKGCEELKKLLDAKAMKASLQ